MPSKRAEERAGERAEERAGERAEQREEGASSLFTPRFVLLLVSQACFGYAFSSYFLLPKYLAAELGAGPAEIGALSAANGIATLASMLTVGVLVDRLGRRRFLTGGALLMAATSLAFLAVNELGWLIYLIRVLQGLAFAMAFVAGGTLTVDHAPPSRLGQAIGLFGLTMLSMNAIAPTVVEALAARASWDHAFVAAAVGALLAVLLSARIEESDYEVDERAGPGALWRVARRPDQLTAAVVIGLVGGCFGTLFVFHQLYALELGLGNVRLFFIAYAIGAIVARLGFGSVADRLGRLPVAATMLVLYAAAAFGMAEVARIGLGPLGAVFGFGHGLFYPSFNAIVVERGEERDRGKVMALYQGWFNAGMAGSGALGVVAERFGYPWVFIAAGLFVTLALAVLVGRRHVWSG